MSREYEDKIALEGPSSISQTHLGIVCPHNLSMTLDQDLTAGEDARRLPVGEDAPLAGATRTFASNAINDKVIVLGIENTVKGETGNPSSFLERLGHRTGGCGRGWVGVIVAPVAEEAPTPWSRDLSVRAAGDISLEYSRFPAFDPEVDSLAFWRRRVDGGRSGAGAGLGAFGADEASTNTG